MITVTFLSAWEKHWEKVSEALPDALGNTLIGVAIVFFALIFISFVISCFKYIGKLEQRKKNKAEAKKAEQNLPQAAIENTVAMITEAEEELTDDQELVAVITAAIYAYESAIGNVEGVRNGLLVRSIKRATKSGWQNA